MSTSKTKKSDENVNDFADELPAGATLMHGQYTIEAFLNAGGFGITYKARDSLDRKVVIKECFPGTFCRRSRALVNARSRAHQKDLASIVRLFVQEARSLAKLEHPNIVGVHQVFEENNTAYMALDFVEGRDLLDVIEDDKTVLAPKDVEGILRKILDAITFIHDQSILHRDISPDNILVDEWYNPILIDFGAAREQASKQSRVLSAMRVVKDGYSPQEFYIAGSDQGPNSDLYALGATFYHVITGELPPSSQVRLAQVAGGEADPYSATSGRVEGYSDNFLKALDKAMAILPKDRLASAAEWLNMLDGIEPTAPAQTSKPVAKETSEASGQNQKQLLMASVAVGALILVGGAFGLGVFGGSEQEASDVAAEQGITTANNETVAAQDVFTATVPTPEPEVAEETETVAVIENTPEPEAEVAPATDTETTAEAEVPSEPNISTTPGEVEDVASGVLPVKPSNDTTVAQDQNSDVQTAEAETELAALDQTSEPAEADTAATEAGDNETVDPVTEFNSYGTLTYWTVVLPFNTGFTADSGATQIVEVNDQAVNDRLGFDQALNQTATPTEKGDVTISVMLDSSNADSKEGIWTLPVLQKTEMRNGLTFESRFRDGYWETSVSAVPTGLNLDLVVGDIVYGDIPTGARLGDRLSLPKLLTEAYANDQKNLSLAIKRGDATWALSLPVSSSAEATN